MNRRELTLILVLGLASGLTLSPVLAEPFNDRGTLWRDAAPSGSVQPEPPVRGSEVPGFFGFNEGGPLWRSVAPAGSDRPHPPVRVTPERGFIDKSRVPGYEL
jgi:hypothetical protein